MADPTETRENARHDTRSGFRRGVVTPSLLRRLFQPHVDPDGEAGPDRGRYGGDGPVRPGVTVALDAAVRPHGPQPLGRPLAGLAGVRAGGPGRERDAPRATLAGFGGGRAAVLRRLRARGDRPGRDGPGRPGIAPGAPRARAALRRGRRGGRGASSARGRFAFTGRD